MQNLTYAQFKLQYIDLIKKLLSYTPGQAGSLVYADKLSDLTESVPEAWESRADAELGNAAKQTPAITIANTNWQ